MMQAISSGGLQLPQHHQTGNNVATNNYATPNIEIIGTSQDFGDSMNCISSVMELDELHFL